MSQKEFNDMAELLHVDELNLFNKDGKLTHSNVSENIGA